MATKLDALPDAGAVLIAHYDSESLVIERAESKGLPYLLTRWMPVGVVYQLDCDAIYAPFDG